MRSNRPRMIFIQLKSVAHRNRIVLVKHRKWFLYGNEICNCFPKVPVFVNNMCGQKHKLLRKTMEIAKQRQYRYECILNRIVCVRKVNNSPVITVSKVKEINEILGLQSTTYPRIPIAKLNQNDSLKKMSSKCTVSSCSFISFRNISQCITMI